MRERKKNFYEEETPEDQWTDIDPEEELYYEWEEKQERLRRLKEERVRVKRSIGIMIGLFCVLVVSMAGYICYYATVHKQEMFDNSYNGYQAQLQKENEVKNLQILKEWQKPDATPSVKTENR